MTKKAQKIQGTTIALNKKAKFDYELHDRFEAGIALLGWEIKSLRAGKGNITDCYVVFKNNEAFLQAAQIQPLLSASTHFVTDPFRNRKLLLNRREISRLQEAVEQKGYTVVPTALYWKEHLIKLEIAIAKGKQLHDKRETEKERDWARDKQRLFQTASKRD